MNFVKQSNAPILKWESLDLNLHNDFLELKKNHVKFTNNVEFTFYNCLTNYKDLKINKKSALILTDFTNNTSIYENKKIATQKNYTESYIDTVLSTWDNKLISIETYQTNDLISLQQLTIENKSASLYKDKDIIRMVFLDDLVLKIKTKENLFLTEDNGILKFAPEQGDEDLNKFNYIMGSDYIYIFKYKNSYKNILMPYLTNDDFLNKPLLSFLTYTLYSRDLNFPYQAKLKLIKPNLNSVIKTSFLQNDGPTKYELNSELNYSPESINKNYVNNFLIHFSLSNNKTDLIKLKNFHTSTYDYADNNKVRFDLPAGTNRIYDALHTGYRETEGHENIFLNYRTNTEPVNFLSDNFSDFVMSPQLTEIPLAEAGFIEDGALYGETPYTSDCVLIQNTNSLDQNVPDIQPTDSSNYIWSCSWLYKQSENSDPIWMDRFYNKAIFKDTYELWVKHINMERHSENLPYYDVISFLNLKPGVTYTYKRLGKNFLKKYIQQNYINKYKILETGKWDEKNIFDLSDNKNHGIFYEKNNLNKNPLYYELKGDNHVIFGSNDLIKSDNQLGISLWLYAEDWKSLQSYQLFGNYYEGGLGLIYESAALAPIFTIVDANKGYIGHFNFKFKQTSPFISFKLPSNLPNNAKGIIGDIIIVRLSDYSYWIFDAFNLIGIKYDVNNTPIEKISQENQILNIEYINQIETDYYNNLYLYDEVNKKITKLNKDGKYINTISISDPTIKGIQVDSNNNLMYSTGYKSVVDNNNVLWEAKGVNLYKNKYIHSSIGAIHALTCDYLNNIWILHGDDLLTVVNADSNSIVNNIAGIHIFNRENVIVDACASKFVTGKRKRYINFIRLPLQSRTIYQDCEKDLLDLAVIIDADTNSLALVDININQYYNIQLDSINLFNEGARIYADGDFSNYQYQRKFSNNLIQKNLSWNVKLNSPGLYNPYLINLKFDTNNLKSGWHHFVLNVNCIEGYAQSFIDGKKVNEDIFDKNKFFIDFKYKTPLLIGATTIRDKTLNDVIGLDTDYKFVGKVADLILYKKTIEPDFVKNLYLSSVFSNNIANMTWNQITGLRSFIEEITGWLKFKVTGIKSKYFNIKIQNFKLTDEKLKNRVVNSLTNIVNNFKPAYTKLKQIYWE